MLLHAQPNKTCPPMLPRHMGVERESRTLHTHRLPTREREERASAIVANQFGTACERLLLVHDDEYGIGMGWPRRLCAQPRPCMLRARCPRLASVWPKASAT